MSEAASASGPDFSQGIALSEIPSESTIAGRVGEDPVLLSSFEGELFAVGGSCTHYGGHLGEGLLRGTTVRCPLHHACFDLKTGAVLRTPALDPVYQWLFETESERVVGIRGNCRNDKLGSPNSAVQRIIIVGGGAAGLACANDLRRRGFDGEVTILSADTDPPCDRPNLSKDYLAGTAPEEWLWLRGDDWYADNRIELRLGAEVTECHHSERRAILLRPSPDRHRFRAQPSHASRV